MRCRRPEHGQPPPASCPEGGIDTNGDFMTQVSQAQGQLWGAMTTQVNQTFNASSEMHIGAVYWVVDTGSFDKTGQFTITNQGYVSAAHEDLEFPAMAAEGTGGNGKAIMLLHAERQRRADACRPWRLLPEHRLRPADRHLDRAERVRDQHRGRRAVAAGRIQRVPGLPRPDPAPLGRLQLGDLPARTAATGCTSPTSTSSPPTAPAARSR